MAKGMTKTALVRHMAEKLEITNKQAAAGLELLAETAVKETKKNGEFTIPGIGKLVKAERKARLGRNPQTGETSRSRPRPWSSSASRRLRRTRSLQSRSSFTRSTRNVRHEKPAVPRCLPERGGLICCSGEERLTGGGFGFRWSASGVGE